MAMSWIRLVLFIHSFTGISGIQVPTLATNHQRRVEASSWSALLKLLTPDLLIVDTETANLGGSQWSDVTEVFYQSQRAILHCNDTMVASGQNGPLLASFLPKALGPPSHQKMIVINCPVSYVVSLFLKVSRLWLAKWQWQWVIVTREEPAAIVADQVSNFMDEWQFAVVEQYSPTDQSFSSPQKQNLLQSTSQQDEFLVYSLHVHNNEMEPGFTRIPMLEASIYPSGNTVVVKSGRGKPRKILDSNDIGKENSHLLQQALFPHPLDLYRNFKGRRLTTTGVQYPPWFSVVNPACKDDPILECIPHTGVDISLLRTLSQALNFSLRFTLVVDQEFGVRKLDGSFTGMIGDISQGKADMASCDLTINNPRSSVADFSYSYFLESLRFATRAPAKLSQALVVLKPFNPLMWSLIIISATLTVFILKGIQKVESWIKGPPKMVLQGGIVAPAPNWTFTKYAMQVIKHLTADGEPMPSHDAFRVYLLFWLMFALVIGALYSGTLTAHMTAPGQEASLDTLEDLRSATSSGMMSMGMLRGTSQVSMFQDAESGVYHDLWKSLLTVGLEKSLTESEAEGTQLMLEGNYAFVSETITLERAMAEIGRKKFHLSRDGFCSASLGMALRKGTPFKPVFDRRLLQMLSGGLVRKWSSDGIDEAVKKEHTMSQEQNSDIDGNDRQLALKLEQLQGGFILLGLGYAISSVAFLGEMLKRRVAEGLSRHGAYMKRRVISPSH